MDSYHCVCARPFRLQIHFYVNRHYSFSDFNRRFNNARVFHTILLNSIVQIIAWGFPFPHYSSLQAGSQPGKVFGSCIHNSVVAVDKTIISRIWSTSILSILYFLIKEGVGECRAFPWVFFLTRFLPVANVSPPSSVSTRTHQSHFALSSDSLRVSPSCSLSLCSTAIYLFSACLHFFLFHSHFLSVSASSSSQAEQ